jgi:hypothetical protein
MNTIPATFVVCCLTLCLSLGLAEKAIKYPVGMRHLEYVDPKRQERPMVLDVYYPALLSRNAGDLFVVPFSTGFRVYRDPKIAFEGKKYPLILLSHGRSG